MVSTVCWPCVALFFEPFLIFSLPCPRPLAGGMMTVSVRTARSVVISNFCGLPFLVKCCYFCWLIFNNSILPPIYLASSNSEVLLERTPIARRYGWVSLNNSKPLAGGL